MAADASLTPPVAWGSVRIGWEPLDDLEEVLRQWLFGQGRVVAPEHPANLLEERGVCHWICRYGVDANLRSQRIHSILDMLEVKASQG